MFQKLAVVITRAAGTALRRWSAVRLLHVRSASTLLARERTVVVETRHRWRAVCGWSLAMAIGVSLTGAGALNLALPNQAAAATEAFMLFSERSIWTMVHGIGLGGAALLGLGAALFYLFATRPASLSMPQESGSRAFASLTTFTAAMLWLTVIVGTYIIFPSYRVTPPPGTTDLSQFPRAFVLANANTAWLHAFAMEIKEHMPWIASMLTTAVAFIAVRYPTATLRNPSLRNTAFSLLAISFAIVSFVSLLGVFVNKVAPLD